MYLEEKKHVHLFKDWDGIELRLRNDINHIDDERFDRIKKEKKKKERNIDRFLDM